MKLERSDVFLADPYENAALKPSRWMLIAGLAAGMCVVVVVLFLALLVLAGSNRESLVESFGGERAKPIAPTPTPPAPLEEPKKAPLPQDWEAEEPDPAP
jgi:uncharacterized membrane protein YqiK